MWIRSQDKRILVNANSINLNYANSDEILGYVNSERVGNPLGRYETEKRALEVLDEIQVQIQSCVSFDKMQGPTRTFMQPVYQMPEN
ncbi:hypothetical protein [Clostridium felsineum]|uniref:Uncharacterized protein n=1 Tax=Clostridium felsineum TaxID=36839 RepID=A0A1S8MDN4_9CLOT|nr:hypothetical protein [Clostridium felsineum]URZ06437.1 hypothetical protein CLROS_017700 [Clostridium felsineum]URZ11472.1 hypothetical protein CROST_021890 [Clostridium felsineum]